MRYKRYRRHYNFLPTWLILLLGIGVLIPLALPWVYQNQDILFVGVVSILVVVLLIVLIIFFFLQKRENNRIRALKIADIDRMSGIEFERYVEKVLQFQGYKTNLTKTSGDFGADIIARKNNDIYVMQLKRYSGTVHIEAVQQAVASMRVYKSNKSMIITNSYFTKAAKELAQANECELVDRTTLAAWILEFQKKR